jgi:predicted nucleic acid-binding protein
LKIELVRHREKLIKYTKLAPQELQELQFLLLKNVIFINENILPVELVSETEKLLTGVDLNDTPFVALTKYLDAKLWTGDKKLSDGIANKKFILTLTTQQIFDLLNNFEHE